MKTQNQSPARNLQSLASRSDGQTLATTTIKECGSKMEEPARSALIALAETEIARQLAIDCIRFLQEKRVEGLDASAAVDRTNWELQLRMNKEMCRHHDAVKEKVTTLLETATAMAGRKEDEP